MHGEDRNYTHKGVYIKEAIYCPDKYILYRWKGVQYTRRVEKYIVYVRGECICRGKCTIQKENGLKSSHIGCS